jgi:hypothetical protein
MRLLIITAFAFFILFSCSPKINVLKTATIKSKGYTDTLYFDNTNKFIVIKAKINGYSCNLIFDTGADVITLQQDNSQASKIKGKLSDINGLVSDINIKHLDDVLISKTHLSDLYSVSMDFPAPFLCFGDGLIGNNAFKSSNILIESGQILLSDSPFDIINKKTTLSIFYLYTNSLHSNIILNNCNIDTCLFDYGGSYDIQLPYKYYENYKECFKPNRISNEISYSYGLNGISVPDTALRVNCNVNFNGIHIDSVNIDFTKNGGKHLGYVFLKRFNKVAINNTINQLSIDSIESNTISSNHIYSFDWIDGYYVVSRTILENEEVKIGDRYDEINSTKSKDFSDYCDFLKWRDSLMKEEWLYLKTLDNKIIKINNRH